MPQLQTNLRQSVASYISALSSALAGPPDPIEDRVRALQEAREKKDIKGWLKAAMPRVFHLGFCPELHDYLISIRHEPEAGTEAPRFHAKTAIGCSGVPLYQALEEPGTYDYYLNVQANEPKALALNIGIKLELEQNEVLRLVYGDQVGRDKWTDHLFVLKNGVVFQAVSMGQSLRGTNYRLRRPNYAVLDDAYEDDDIRNLESTRRKNDWVESTLQPMMAADRPAVFHWQGTAINDVDGLKRMEEKSKIAGSRVKFRRFAAYDTETKTALWPALRSYDDWIARRDAPGTNITIHNREYLNLRGSDAESIVKAEWLDSPGWEYDPNTLRFDVNHFLLGVVIACDPSIGKREENDPTGFAYLIKTQRMDGSLPVYWIEQLRNERLSLQARVDHLKAWIADARRRFPAAPSLEVRIETVAGFKDFGDVVAAQVEASCTMVDRVADKLTHLESKSFLFQNRRVFVNKFLDSVLKTELRHQLVTNHPPHDDLRDAVLLGLDTTDAGLWR